MDDTLTSLDARIAELADRGEAVSAERLALEFPALEPSAIKRVVESHDLLRAWLATPDPRGMPAAPDLLAPGDRLGGYSILRRVRGGGMGQVYQAVQESLYPRQVALKVHRVGARAEDELRRARLEAEVASRLSHPNLAAVYDMGHDPGRGLVYFSMQLVEGLDLGELLRESILRIVDDPTEERRRVRRIVTRMSEVAGALAELHGRGFVHRDVKPENILLRQNAGRDGRSESAVLVDFGLARARRALEGDDTSRVAGTPGYLPPESSSPASGVAPAWDVYALGVTATECLGGARSASAGPSIDRGIAIESLRSASTAVDTDLAAVLARAVADDPRQRYADAGAFQADLESWLAGEPVAARPLGVAAALWRRARRSPRSSALALVALALVVTGVAVAARTADAVAQARRALTLLEGGELARGFDGVASTAPLIRRFALRGRPGLAAAFEPDSDAPLARVAAAARTDEPADAAVLAAAHLQRDGWQSDGAPSHPELQAFLLAGLRANPATLEHRVALRTFGRLVYESPIASVAAFERTTPFRERLRELLNNDAVASEGRAYATFALGGCGSPRDLMTLLERVKDDGAFREERRVALAALPNIIRRTHLTGRASELDRTVWRALPDRTRSAVHEAVAAGVLARDPAPGVLTDVVGSLGDLFRVQGWPPPELPPEISGSAPWKHLPATARIQGPWTESLVAALFEAADSADGGPLANDADWPRVVGITAARVARPGLREALLARLARSPAAVVLFEEGWEAAERELVDGIDAFDHPDSSSFLSLRLDPGQDLARSVPHTRGGPLDDVWPHGASVYGPVRGDPVPIAAADGATSDPGAPRAGFDVLARWKFRNEGQPTLSGHATSAHLGGGGYVTREDHTAHVRLPRPGSWLEARFTTPDRTDFQRYFVTVVHTAASRPELPGSGAAWVRIELDGAPLVERLMLDNVGQPILILHSALLWPSGGEHVIRIEVVESTTTYWVREVRLEAECIR